MDETRRKFLYLSGAAAASALAGCSSTPTSDGGGGATATDESTPTTAGGGSAPPGANVLGGPEDLQSAPTVAAKSLDSNSGAGQFVFSPAVVWVPNGATVTWNVESGSHSATAYHSEYDHATRIPEGATPFDSGVLSEGSTFEHTFETPGIYNYFCRPHEGLGMVGLVVVGGPQGGPGTTDPNVQRSAAAEQLRSLLETASLLSAGGSGGTAEYGFQAATWDTYWYSLFNMSTNIAMSGNGVLFPNNDRQREVFRKRIAGIRKKADVDEPPIMNPNLNVLPFTGGDPAFTQKPVFDAGDGRPDASTLTWDRSKSTTTVSPASVAWTHLKGVTWAKNFQNHFDVLPASVAPKFRSQVLTTLAQLGVKAALVDGGPKGNGLLTDGETMKLLSAVDPVEGAVVDATARPTEHAAMLWFLSDLVSLANGGWFGYENPEPLIPPGKLQKLADGVAGATMDQFSPDDVVSAGSTRDLGEVLGAVAWYGTHAGSEELATRASEYASALADTVAANVEGSGRVGGGTDNQAATQGVVGQGLTWVSQLDGIDRTDLATRVLNYLVDDLWDEDAGVFATGTDDSTYVFSARDAGDVTGGVNAADAVLGLDVRDQFATFFDEAFNRGRLQRAQRPVSVDGGVDDAPPLPPKAGGEYGQAAVYNTEVAHDAGADEWSVTDRRFTTDQALYLANQDIWMSHWGGEYFQGRGVPGENDTPA